MSEIGNDLPGAGVTEHVAAAQLEKGIRCG